MTCPKCHRDVWLFDASTWTCKLGHHTAVEGSVTPIHRKRLPAALLALAAGAAGALVIDGVQAVIGAL